MTSPTSNLKDLPGWVWLWFPPAMIALQIVAYLIDPVFEEHWFNTKEFGAVELGTVIVYLPGIVAGIMAFSLCRRLPDKWLGIWILIFILGCIFIAGEEASWGQHYLHWNTPEHWAHLNKQQETNLHNSTTWLNQKPRIAMELWILIGGIIMPLRYRLKKISLNPETDWQYWLWPTYVCLPAALLCFFIKLPLHIAKWTHAAQPMFIGFNLNETHEYNIAVFLTLYLCSIYLRIKQMPDKPA